MLARHKVILLECLGVFARRAKLWMWHPGRVRLASVLQALAIEQRLEQARRIGVYRPSLRPRRVLVGRITAYQRIAAHHAVRIAAATPTRASQRAA